MTDSTPRTAADLAALLADSRGFTDREGVKLLVLPWEVRDDLMVLAAIKAGAEAAAPAAPGLDVAVLEAVLDEVWQEKYGPRTFDGPIVIFGEIASAIADRYNARLRHDTSDE